MTDPKRPLPFNVGGEDSDDVPTLESLHEALQMMLLRRLFNQSGIQVALYLTDNKNRSLASVAELWTARTMPEDADEWAFVLSPEATDELLTEMANGKTVVIRIVRG